jgi:hypothetical protein
MESVSTLRTRGASRSGPRSTTSIAEPLEYAWTTGIRRSCVHERMRVAADDEIDRLADGLRDADDSRPGTPRHRSDRRTRPSCASTIT